MMAQGNASVGLAERTALFVWNKSDYCNIRRHFVQVLATPVVRAASPIALTLESKAYKKHNGSPSPREFGLCLIKFQVSSSESRGEGGPYFIIKKT